jgi:hypothetical protein
MPNWELIWIAYLDVSNVIGKLGSKHGIDALEIKFLVEGSKGIFGLQVTDDKHGSRTFVRVDYSNRFIVEMYIDKKNSDYSEWSLRTAKLVRKNSKNGG